MDTLPSFNYDHGYEYNQLHDFGYDSRSTSHFDSLSEVSDEVYSIYEQTSTDSYFDDYEDDLSSSYSIFETESSIDELQSGSGNTSIHSRSQGSIVSRRRNDNELVKPVVINGILKIEDMSIPNVITRDAIEKIRENELEDVLQHARDIVTPDPAARSTLCIQPAKVVQGSFKHLLSIKETKSKTGAFVHRTIEIIRDTEDDLGFSIREGDGWEKKDGIFVSRVDLGTVFEQYSILAVGDEILQINKIDIRSMKINDIVRLMYIPRRLSVTIKVLTPFSKKRIKNTKLDTQRYNQRTTIEKPVSDNFYKVAQLHIGSKKRDGTKPSKTILVRNKHKKENTEAAEEPKKISPYRAMEGGKLPPIKTKSNLSPISEKSSEEIMRIPTKQSYVTWSDQR